MLRRKLNATFDESIGQLVIMALILVVPTTALTVWAALLSWAGPLVGLFAIGLFGVIAWATVHVRQVFSPKARMLAGEELGKRIRDYFLDNGHAIGPTLWPDDDFQFTVTDIFGRIIVVHKRSSQPKVETSVAFSPSPEDLATLSKLSSVQKLEFTYTLRIELAKYGVWFENVNEPFANLRVWRDHEVTPEFNIATYLRDFELVGRAYILVTSYFALKALEIRKAS